MIFLLLQKKAVFLNKSQLLLRSKDTAEDSFRLSVKGERKLQVQRFLRASVHTKESDG